MSQSWPPDHSQYPPRRRQQPPSQGYGAPEQGYGGYGPSSRGRGGYENDWGPSQGEYQADWGQPQGGRQGSQGDPWSQGSSGQYQPGGQYPGYAGPLSGPPNGQPYGPQYGQPYGPQYGQPYGYEGGYRNPPPPPAHEQRNWLLPIVVVVLCLVVAAGAASALLLEQRGGNPHTGIANATANTSATTTPSVPAGFSTFSDNTTHVRFLLPSSWKTSGSVSGSTGLSAFDADQTSGILVKQYNFVGNNTGGASGALAGAAGSGTVANKTGPTNVTLAGATWVQEAGDITNSGVTLHMVVLVTTHDQSTYLIGYFAVKSSYDTANRTYFQPVVQSFSFTQ